MTAKGSEQEHTLALIRLARAYSALDKKRESEDFSLEAIDSHAKMLKGSCLSRKYINSRSELLWECKSGHRWHATPEEILGNGSWCPLCTAKAGSIQTQLDDQAAEFVPPITMPDQNVEEIQC